MENGVIFVKCNNSGKSKVTKKGNDMLEKEYWVDEKSYFDPNGL
jgi:hypothetical protein